MNNKEVATRVVERILDMVKAEGKLPWTKPWGTKAGVEVADGYTEITWTPRFWSRHGRPYDGINVLILGMTGLEGEWITFKQCQSEGGRVKKGAKATTVVFWSMIKKEETDPDTGEKKVRTIPLLKTYNVFHISQCEGLEQKHNPKPRTIRIAKTKWKPLSDCAADTIPAAENVVAGYITRESHLKLVRDQYSDRACYYPDLDKVDVPMIQQFDNAAEFYSTLFHELGHSTGHETRLNRDIRNFFGSDKYSREELVAEITAASILNILGIESGNSFRNSAAYVQDWSEHIKNDPMMFVTAAARADKAVNLILGIETETGLEDAA